MNTTNINITIKGFSLALAMVLGVVMFSGVANAQNNRDQRNDDRYNNQNRQNDQYDRNNNDRYDNRDRNNQSINRAFQKGYHEGLKQGKRDARNPRRGNVQYGNNNIYGNNGSNNNGYGNNGGYNNNRSREMQAYQQGFQRGYNEALITSRNSRGRGTWPF
ncbi:hypothetical protein BH10ACI2_BH10ACI2_20650 [soil metagenome]